MRRLSLIFCIVFALMLAAAPAFCQDQDQMMTKAKGACKADVDKFCKGIKPGQGRIWACLKSNEAQLSDACKTQMAQMREHFKEFKAACMADVQKFCQGIPAGKGKIAACLKSHETELSDSCKEFFNK